MKIVTRLIFSVLMGLLLFAYSGCEKYVIEVGEVGDVSFSADIIPILTTYCSGCHPSAAGLDLTEGEAYNSIMTNSMVNVDAPEESPIYVKIEAGHGSLTTNDKNKILAWIQQGALDD